MGHDAQDDADAAAVRSHRITSDLQSRLQTATNAHENRDKDREEGGQRKRGTTPRPEAIFFYAWSSLLFIITVH